MDAGERCLTKSRVGAVIVVMSKTKAVPCFSVAVTASMRTGFPRRAGR